MKKVYIIAGLALLGAAGVATATLWSTPNANTAATKVEQQATLVDEEPLAQAPSTTLPLVTVYKSPTCGCCQEWVDYLENEGFSVEAHNVNDMLPYKQQAKLGAGMGSCHTAFVDGYAIEGHVPADDIRRLLRERPQVSGLTAPGMPMVSPGMAEPGQAPSGYDVISYKDGKQVGVFSSY